MSKKTYGIIGLVMYIAAFLVGMYGILQYSATAAGIYLVGSLAVFLIFVSMHSVQNVLSAITVPMLLWAW